jgi:hypothetical protein
VSLLTFLGLASMAFVCWFTWWTYRDDRAHGPGQTRRQAIIEVWIGIVIGFGLNWILNWFLLPLVGAKFTGLENFFLGWIYTSISILRGYAIRRWADRHIHAFSAWLSERVAALSLLRGR